MKISKAITGLENSGSFRVYMVISTDAVQQAHELHHTSPLATHLLGRALTGTGIMGLMLREPGFKVTFQFKGDGPAQQVLCTADSAGHVKGYIVNPLVDLPPKENGSPDVGGAIGKGMLTCIRDAGTTEPYVGKIELATGEIGDDLAEYFYASEQQHTLVSLGVKLDENGDVAASGGMIIQVLPDATDEALTAVEEWLPLMPQLSDLIEEITAGIPEDITDEEIEWIMRELLGRSFEGMPSEHSIRPMDILDFGWKCDCSDERLDEVMMSLGAKELTKLIEEDGQAEVTCQFCGKAYYFDKEHLTRLRNMCLSKYLN